MIANAKLSISWMGRKEKIPRHREISSRNGPVYRPIGGKISKIGVQQCIGTKSSCGDVYFAHCVSNLPLELTGLTPRQAPLNKPIGDP